MRVMSKEPGKGWKVAEIENTLEALQQGVGGKLEAVTLASDACILCNEEGRLLGMPYNITICGVSFVGPLLIVGIAGEDFAGLTEQQVDRLRDMGAIQRGRPAEARQRMINGVRCLGSAGCTKSAIWAPCAPGNGGGTERRNRRIC